MIIEMKKKWIFIVMLIGLTTGCADKSSVSEEVQMAEKVDEIATCQEQLSEEKEYIESTADEIEDSFKFFRIEEDISGNAAIREYTGNELEVIIPDRVNEYVITKVGGFINHTELTGVVIPDTVQEILPKAFVNCYALASVKLGENVKKIGDYAFDGVFEEIVLPEELESIGKSAFKNVPLRKIVIPEKVSYIGESAFESTKLEDVIIHGNVKALKENTFKDCLSLREVVVESGVQNIEQAFKNCTMLNTITIPASVKTIAFHTFSDCQDLTIITEVGSYAEEYAKEQGISVQYYSN